MKFLAFQLLVLGALILGQTSAPQGGGINTLFEKAQRALSAKEYPEAEKCFREVLSRNPRFTAAYVNLGVVYIHTGNYEAVVKSFEQAKKLAPQEVGIDLNLGLAYDHELAFPKAILAFRRVLQSLPNSLQARYVLGMSYFMTDDYQHTVEALESLRDSPRTISTISLS
jgi:tetratricopeptide (TPR) repeat protein